MRATLLLIALALFRICLSGVAQADVIVFRAGVKPPNDLLIDPGTGNKTTYEKYMYKGNAVFLGHIHSINRSDPPVLNFQPVTIKGTLFTWAKRGKKDLTIQVPRLALQHIIQEFDGLLDLWWMFSNRDYVVRKSGVVKKGDRWGIGSPKVHAYFLNAGGVPGQHLVYNEERLAKWVKKTPLVEGWLVNVLRRGPMPSDKRDDLRKSFFRDGLKGLRSHPDFAVEDWDLSSELGFHPLFMEGDVGNCFPALLEMAARDKKYGGPFRGMTRNHAILHQTFVQVIVRLCEQVDLPIDTEQGKNAVNMGYEARDAVLLQLCCAAVKNVVQRETDDTPVTLALNDKEREVELAIGMNDKYAALEALHDMKRLVDQLVKDWKVDPDVMLPRLHSRVDSLEKVIKAIKGPAIDLFPPGLAERLPITLIDGALIALEIIREGASWKIPRYDVDDVCEYRKRRKRPPLQANYDEAVALWAKEAEAKAKKKALTDADALALEAATAALVPGKPGKSLTHAILSLARFATTDQKKDNTPRANDDQRYLLHGALLKTLLHLCQEAKEVYDWKLDKIRGLTKKERARFSGATRVFREHVAYGLLNGVRSVPDGGDTERKLAQNVLSHTGHPWGHKC